MYQINFTFNSKKISFIKKNVLSLYMEILNWLQDNNYSFKGRIHEKFIRKIYTIDEINNIIKKNNSYRLNDFYNISDSGNFIYRGGNINKIYPNILMMLENFGIDKSTIKTEGFETNPAKFKLISDEIQDIPDEDMNSIEMESEDGIKPFTRMFPSNFKASQSQEEIESKDFTQNPFIQAICVLGRSGAGKSTTIENTLENEGHNFEFIIPSASTTGLLSQFSPSISGYIQSRLGKMIVEAFNNPTTLYTAVFDECHKSNVIEMINDELLQAISTKRNMGRRFISLDEDTSELYKGVETHRGNILIPDNFGFIFISSKPKIIANNSDFFNRVDLVVLTEDDRSMSTTDELLSKVLLKDEKMKLSSTRND